MKVFSMRNGKIAAPMDLEEVAGKIRAYDSTGCLVAVAHYIHGTGWVIVRTGTREVLGTEASKSDARLLLRRVVGEG